MFKRAIQVSVVKDKKNQKDPDQIPMSTTDYVQLVRETGKDVVIAAGALLGTYIALDTVRQVTIAIVKAKV